MNSSRDKSIDLPQTGWARIESISRGLWTHLNPHEVIIPAVQGCEKKKWFEIDGYIKGITAQKNDVKRIYMLTQPANEEYLNMTGHDRMPVKY